MYNRPRLVAECLDSVLVQTNPNWECIVVDDGSTDNTWKVLEDYAVKDDRIRIFKRDKGPKGANLCRNMGIEKAYGKFVSFLDSDDLLSDFYVQQRLQYMQKHTKLDFAVFPVLMIDHHTGKGDTLLLKKVPAGLTALQLFLQHDIVWCISAPVWRASFIKTINFDTQLPRFQDIDFHIKALHKEPVYNVNYDLPPDCFYRKDSKNKHAIKLKNTKTPKSSFILYKYIIETFGYEKNFHKNIKLGYRRIYWNYLFNITSCVYVESYRKLGSKRKYLSLRDRFFVFLLNTAKKYKLNQYKNTGYYKVLNHARKCVESKIHFLKYLTTI